LGTRYLTAMIFRRSPGLRLAMFFSAMAAGILGFFLAVSRCAVEHPAFQKNAVESVAAPP
jgi:hypothetical protein